MGKRKKKIEVIDLSKMEYPKSDIVKIEEVVTPDEAIIDADVVEVINESNNDVEE